MCGILLYYSPHRSPDQFSPNEYIEFNEDATSQGIPLSISKEFDSIIPYIRARGPNYSSLRISEEHSTAWFSSVLSLREPFTPQSINVGDKYILQFNGELYNPEIRHNDAQFIASRLQETDVDLLQVIQSLDGEFAYTIYDMQQRKFYFGRDNVGKRSLSYRLCKETGELYISSVTGAIEGFLDCIAGIVYVYDVTKRVLDASLNIAPKYNVTEFLDESLSELDDYVNKLYQKIDLAVERRVNSIHPIHIENSPVAILFSGGLDCSIIASLVCGQLQKTSRTGCTSVVELLNVGFENPRTGIMPHDTPDRKLAIKSTKTLKELYPDIEIRLVEIDVSYAEYLREKPRVIDLMYPKNTEMDLSIAIAFYFASKGYGVIRDIEGKATKYQREGIVLFSGLGADELYGGYHKLANKSTPELQEELTRQINNIYDRNLNRDDKVISTNGVEVRYPFLDQEVIEYSTQNLPINYKLNKMILRRVASDKLGLKGICDEPKRAIQFGTKSAKMTKNGNRHGTDLLK